MTWEPDMDTGDNVPRTGKLLKRAITKLNQKVIETLYDETGVFGYVTEDCVLVAKEYIWGFIVSAHKRAVISAINTKKDLVMYIGRGDVFYAFNPSTIMGNSDKNKRFGQTMLNFSVKLGTRRN